MPSRKTKPATVNGRKLCRSLMDAVNDVILIFDPRTFRILDANQRAVEAYGYSLHEITRKEIRDLTHEVPNYSDLVRTVKSIERTDFNKAGENLAFLVSLSLIDYWGRKAVLSINSDISERKRIEAAIAANEKKMRLLVQGISEIVALIDAEGGISFISPQVEKVLDLPSSELLGKNVFDFVHPDDRERAAREYLQTLQDPGESIPSALRLSNRAGEWIPFETIANNQLRDPDISAVIVTARDLRFRREAQQTIEESNADFDKRFEERAMELAKANAALRIENQQRRHTEKQLQHSLSLLYATLESTADGILVISRDRLISSCNQKFLDMWRIPRIVVTGLREEEVLAVALPQVQDVHVFELGIKRLYADPEAVSFDTIKLKDGRIFERYSQPERVGEEIVGRVWSFRDVTKAHRLEAELRQSQKMEAVGRLAGGVAHDFNNLLMLISGYAGQILEDPALQEKHREDCEQLVDATKRAASLTRQLLAFSRKQPVTPQLVDLNTVARDTEKMLERLLPKHVKLVFNLSPGQLQVYADASQVELMIMNLALNGRDAMPDGGLLTIATSSEVFAWGEGKSARHPVTDFVLLKVSDTGHGMSPEIKEHLFEPFFTTKEVGKSTGLGLSTVYGVVEQAGGRISVESEPNQGTTFRIFFPRASPQIAEKAKKEATKPKLEAPRRKPVLAGRETILVVEDEPGIRAMTRVYLESLGYKVLEAGDGSEAMRMSREYRDRIALVLTDIIMPGMRGDELVRAIREDRPETRAVFISGYADPLRLDPEIPVLEKPFTFPELGKRLRALLDDSRWRQRPAKAA